MKKKILFILFIVSLILLGGCIQKPSCNASYFEYKTGECCSDQNSNQICDKDENIKESPKETKNEVTGLTPYPVQALTVETCEDMSYFDCVWSYITENEIQFKLRTTKAGVAIVEKVELPNIPCSKEFEDLSIENGMRYDEVRQFNIKCELKKNSVESDLNIYFKFYDRDGFEDKDTSKEWVGYVKDIEIATRKNEGWISGMVRGN